MCAGGGGGHLAAQRAALLLWRTTPSLWRNWAITTSSWLVAIAMPLRTGMASSSHPPKFSAISGMNLISLWLHLASSLPSFLSCRLRRHILCPEVKGVVSERGDVTPTSRALGLPCQSGRKKSPGLALDSLMRWRASLTGDSPAYTFEAWILPVFKKRIPVWPS